MACRRRPTSGSGRANLASISILSHQFRWNEPEQFALHGFGIWQINARQPAFFDHDSPSANQATDGLAELRLVSDEHERICLGIRGKDFRQLVGVKAVSHTIVF